VATLGRLDILVNNAGLALVGAVADAPEEEWERMLAVNVEAVLTMTRAALPHLVRAAEDSPRGVADLVNISSTAGRVARPSTAVYSLTKFGVNAFSESLRQELQPRRVRVGRCRCRGLRRHARSSCRSQRDAGARWRADVVR